MIDIVGEMLAGVRENKSDLNGRIGALYLFLFRRVTEAKINSDASALAEALQILDFERQTWQLICEKFGGAPPPVGGSQSFSTGQSSGAKSGVSWQA
jgi:flagellin-specific chaperone FliS